MPSEPAWGQRDDDSAVRHRLLLGYLVLAAVIVVGGLYIVATVRDRNVAVERDDEIWRPSQVAARDLLGYAIDQETGQRGFLVTGAERFLEPYEAGRIGVSRSLRALHDLLDDEPDLGPLVARVESVLTTWQQNSAEPEIQIARQSLPDAQRSVESGPGKDLFDEFRAAHDELVVAIDARSAEVVGERNRAFRTVVVAMGIAVTGIVTSAALTLVLARQWISQLRETRQRLRSTVRTLQAGLLPHRIPQTERAEVAAAYVPATDDLEVGGDFYDVAQRAHSLLTITVGDVCGHDVDAAVMTGMVRHTIAAATSHIDDPAEVLRWANRAMLDHGGDDGRFVTVAHCHLDTGTGVLRLALAGHPRPVLIPAGGEVPTEIGSPGLMLGIEADLPVQTVDVQLGDGDQVLFYTDGLIENSRPRLDPAALAAMITHSRGGTATETSSNLLDRFQRLDLRSSRDDVALIVLRLVAASPHATAMPTAAPAVEARM